jgi:peptide/nickel transport system permease protein
VTQNRQTSTVDIDGLNDSAFKVRLRRNIEILQSVLANPTTVIGMVIVVSLLLMALLAPIITEPNMPDPYQMPRDWKAARSAPLTPGHVLGTTNRGGDVFYGVVWGARTSLKLSLIVVCLTVVVGVTIGSIAGIVGGKVDEILMRIVDVFLSIPELIFALAIAAILGPSFTNIILALVVVFWVKYARIMRAQVIRIKQRDYVDAARVMGDSKMQIYLKDILPNSFSPVMVQATLDMGNIVLVGATLSFIGLSEGRWWASTFPGLMVFLWALAFNLVGDGLRDVLDPRTETKR